MYETRQHKDKVSRRIDTASGIARQRMVTNDNATSLVINKNNIAIQLRPKDIKAIYTLAFDEFGKYIPKEDINGKAKTKGKGKAKVEESKEEVNEGRKGLVAKGMNWLNDRHLLNSYSQGDPFIGGHLLRHSFGGVDDFTNVVAWSSKTERKYSDFENKYITELSRKAIDNNKLTKFQFYVSASFSDASNDIMNAGKVRNDNTYKFRRVVKRSLETIPTNVSVNVEDFRWEHSGLAFFAGEKGLGECCMENVANFNDDKLSIQLYEQKIHSLLENLP